MGLSNVGRTFWEEWQPCITVMWHYAKTPRSTSGFLEIIFGLFFGKYVIVQCWEDFLGGMATLHYGYVALCKNTMEHKRISRIKFWVIFWKVCDGSNIVMKNKGTMITS